MSALRTSITLSPDFDEEQIFLYGGMRFKIAGTCTAIKIAGIGRLSFSFIFYCAVLSKM